eukprot:3546454-Amphidinium_carterae.1
MEVIKSHIQEYLEGLDGNQFYTSSRGQYTLTSRAELIAFYNYSVTTQPSSKATFETGCLL